MFLHCGHDSEAGLALMMDPIDYNRSVDPNAHRTFTIIQNAFFHLGAMEATIVEREPQPLYRGLFTAFFPHRWEYYEEFLQTAHALGASVEAFFTIGLTNKNWYLSSGEVVNGKLVVNDSFVPERYQKEIVNDLARIREWSEISDMYFHISPPQRSLMRAAK